jgi:hypothetical protein
LGELELCVWGSGWTLSCCNDQKYKGGKGLARPGWRMALSRSVEVLPCLVGASARSGGPQAWRSALRRTSLSFPGKGWGVAAAAVVVRGIGFQVYVSTGGYVLESEVFLNGRTNGPLIIQAASWLAKACGCLLPTCLLFSVWLRSFLGSSVFLVGFQPPQWKGVLDCPLTPG